MINNVKAVIFDLDGTLVDSMWMWINIDIEYLARFDIPLPEGLQREIEGMSMTETAIYFKNRFHIEDSVEKIKADWNQMAWDYYANRIGLKPYVVEFLSELKEKGIKMGIATSNSHELVDLVTKNNQIHSYFSSIRTSCDVERGKPFPDVYLKVAEELEVDPSECLVFEDIVQGIQAGKNAGMRVFAIEDEYSADTREEKKQAADYYIETYKDVLGLINKEVPVE